MYGSGAGIGTAIINPAFLKIRPGRWMVIPVWSGAVRGTTAITIVGRRTGSTLTRSTGTPLLVFGSRGTNPLLLLCFFFLLWRVVVEILGRVGLTRADHWLIDASPNSTLSD